tara:strand:+ start:163 stop:606 length:444 start_codon:yes stop_codon:yes gene_type:complete
MNNSSRKNIFTISFFVASILLSSCSNTTINSGSNSSNKNETNLFPASREDVNLYRQIGTSYFCLARKAKVDFPKSISIASSNFALIISEKHGSFIGEIGDKKLTNDQIYQGSYLQLIEGAIQLCPDQVPEEEKEKFIEVVEKLNKNN